MPIPHSLPSLRCPFPLLRPLPFSPTSTAYCSHYNYIHSAEKQSVVMLPVTCCSVKLIIRSSSVAAPAAIDVCLFPFMAPSLQAAFIYWSDKRKLNYCFMTMLFSTLPDHYVLSATTGHWLDNYVDDCYEHASGTVVCMMVSSDHACIAWLSARTMREHLTAIFCSIRTNILTLCVTWLCCERQYYIKAHCRRQKDKVQSDVCHIIFILSNIQRTRHYLNSGNKIIVGYPRYYQQFYKPLYDSPLLASQSPCTPSVAREIALECVWDA